eukprot:GFYU01003059.1.p1 GENE.GFYU01003059.1~~GFYU01003059.1.p1  ORF type:complete len:424 (-),score=90.25 GFYU01003059.1:662-1933(-)
MGHTHTHTRMLPGKRKRKTVLDEDAYTGALDKIIQRDFFPDLPKIRRQYDYLKAEERGDELEMNRIRLEMNVESTRNQQTPHPATPHTAHDQSVLMTPRSIAGTDAGASESGVNRPHVKTNVSLDQFVNMYTSEDNASFDKIMQKMEEERIAKNQWLQDFNRRQAQRDQLLLTDGKSKKELEVIENYTRGQIETWGYKEKNSLMYYPQGITTPIASTSRGPPKEVNYRATTISTVFPDDAGRRGVAETDRGTGATNAEMSAKRRLVSNEKVNLDDFYKTPRNAVPESPNVGGYGFLLTPSPRPGVEASPFMTWGQVEGTPIDLSDVDPFDGAQKFKIPETPAREQTLLDLNESIKKKKAAQRHSQTTDMSHIVGIAPFGAATTAWSGYRSPRDVGGFSVRGGGGVGGGVVGVVGGGGGGIGFI